MTEPPFVRGVVATEVTADQPNRNGFYLAGKPIKDPPSRRQIHYHRTRSGVGTSQAPIVDIDGQGAWLHATIVKPTLGLISYGHSR
jgi:hypothetical protein